MNYDMVILNAGIKPCFVDGDAVTTGDEDDVDHDNIAFQMTPKAAQYVT